MGGGGGEAGGTAQSQTEKRQGEGGGTAWVIMRSLDRGPGRPLHVPLSLPTPSPTADKL